MDTLTILLFLFCLVAMFLALYTPPTHALTIDLPAPIPDDARSSVNEEMLLIRIGVDPDGTPTFNAVRVTPRDLALMLEAAAHMEWTPGVIFEPHPKARYKDALPVLGEIKQAGLADWQFCLGGIGLTSPFQQRMALHTASFDAADTAEAAAADKASARAR